MVQKPLNKDNTTFIRYFKGNKLNNDKFQYIISYLECDKTDSK